MGTAVPMALMAAAAAVSAFSSIQGGRANKSQADYQARQAEADARAEKAAAEVRASRIRDMVEEQRAAARAAFAASGVETGEGTPVVVEREITRRGEEDAVLEILGGEAAVRRGEAYAQGLRLQGSRERTAGYLKGTASLLQMGSEVAQRWPK